MSTMNDTFDQQYQQQQLEQLKFETSQVSLDPTDDKSWIDQGLHINIVEKLRSYIENGRKKRKIRFVKYTVVLFR
jgi:hypothetical protein